MRERECRVSQVTCSEVCLEQQLKEAVGKEREDHHLKVWTGPSLHKLGEAEEGRGGKGTRGEGRGREGSVDSKVLPCMSSWGLTCRKL